MERSAQEESCTFSDLLKRQDSGPYANTVKELSKETVHEDFVGYESLNFSHQNKTKTGENVEKMAVDISSIITTINRLKITCVVQSVCLLIAVIAFAVYEAEHKPVVFADKLINGATGLHGQCAIGHVEPGLHRDSETAQARKPSRP